MKMPIDLPMLLCESQHKWDAWLKEHHATSPGIFLQIAKKGSDIVSVSYTEALEVALCYGWIDGQKRALDSKFFLQKFTHRRPKSIWSKVNTQKATELIVQGRMQASGLKEVESAKQDGRWAAAYDSSNTSTMPADFQAELDKNPAAKDFFATLNKTNQYAIYFRIQTAKKAETRRAWIEKFIVMLTEQKKLHP